MDPDPSAADIDLFDRVVVLPPEQRRAYLDLHCPDPGTRAEIESLLDSYADAGNFLGERGDAAGGDGGFDDPHAAGTHIAAYELLELIGEGGFARVFRARQSRPVRREVALKIVKQGMDTRAVIARFELERQALAMMDHPNIAAVYDAGATDAGRPYFVMELVRGPRITQYCAGHGLSVRDRLRLFADVCLAVHHAHSKGVLHRDIKPSNLLVTTVDGRPTPKVIDFGIAKAVQERLTDSTLVTQEAQLLGTPQYMSPEQARSGGTDVDTRSDVYSLGAVLYELLAGAPPPLGDGPTGSNSAFEQISRLTSDEEFPPPSARAASPELHRQLRGELDWIVGACLEKDRARRYESAAALAADLRAFLAGRPVAAAPAGALYRARKFVRRHAAAVTAAGLVAVTLVTGTIVSTVMAVRAVRAERLARDRLSQVEAANASLGAVNDFLNDDLIGAADPNVTRGRAMTVREALDNAAAAVETKFRDDPLIEAAVRDSVSMAYLNLGHPGLAEPHGQRALEQRRRYRGPEHAETLASVNNYGIVLKALGRHAEAEALSKPALEAARRVLGEDHRTTLSLLDVYGTSLAGQGRWAEAEPVLREAWTRAAAAMGDGDERTLTAQNNYARVLQLQSRWAEAEPVFRRVLEARRIRDGDDAPSTLLLMNNLALVLKELAHYPEAEALYAEALNRRRRVLGDDHPDTIGSMSNYAVLLHRLGRSAEAERLSGEAMDRRRKTLGPDHRDTLMSMNNHAELLRATGRAAEAEPLAREAMAGRQRVLGVDHPEAMSSANNYAVILLALDRDAEAEPLLRRVVEYRRARHGDDHPLTRTSLSNHANALRGLGRAEEAAPLALLAVESARRSLGEDHPDTIKFTNNYAAVLKAMERLDEALTLYRQVMDRYRARFGPDHPDALTSAVNYATTLAALSRDAEAEPVLAEVYALAARSTHPPRLVAVWMAAYGPCLARLGRWAEAEPALLEARRRLVETGQQAHPRTREVVAALAEACDHAGRATDAERWRVELAGLGPTTRPTSTRPAAPAAPATRPATAAAPQ